MEAARQPSREPEFNEVLAKLGVTGRRAEGTAASDSKNPGSTAAPKSPAAAGLDVHHPLRLVSFSDGREAEGSCASASSDAAEDSLIVSMALSSGSQLRTRNILDRYRTGAGLEVDVGVARPLDERAIPVVVASLPHESAGRVGYVLCARNLLTGAQRERVAAKRRSEGKSGEGATGATVEVDEEEVRGSPFREADEWLLASVCQSAAVALVAAQQVGGKGR